MSREKGLGWEDKISFSQVWSNANLKQKHKNKGYGPGIQ